MIAVLGFIPLMGLPGALVFMLSKPIVHIIYGPMAFEHFEQSLSASFWGLALLLAVLWPISIPIAYGLCQKIFGQLPFFSIKHLIPFCIFVLIGSTIISSITVSMNDNLRRLSSSEILSQAIQNGKLSLVKKHWNADNIESLGNPLFIALENKQAQIAQFFLDNGTSPHNYTKGFVHYEPGITPLHTAAKNGMIDILEKILQAGVDPNIRSTNGKVPLHTLSFDKDALQVVEILKSYKADFAAVDKDGNTPLICLTMINAPMLKYRPMIAQKLIDFGCPKDGRNNQGQTALSIIQEEQPYEYELIQVLSD